MPNILFTERTISSLAPGVYFDDKTPAFGIRVLKNRKTWMVVKGKDRRKIRLGHFPTLSLADARQKARQLLSSDADTSHSIAFPKALDAFLEQRRATIRPGSYRVLSGNLRKYFPWTKPLRDITHHDVLKAIDAIKYRSAANHAFKDIRTFFNWCIPRYLDRSPCTGLKSPHKANKRTRTLTDDELKLIWQACDQWVVTGEMSKANCSETSPTVSVTRGRPLPASFCTCPEIKENGQTTRLPVHFATIVKLLILTGQRRGEIAALQTSWIQDQLVTFPSSVTKNGRTHSFPLGELAQNIVCSAARLTINQSSLLFPARGTSTKSFNGWSKSKKLLDKISGLTGYTLHDIRRTFRTNSGKLGVAPHICERLVNHISARSDMEQTYDMYTYMPEMRAAVERYEAWFSALLVHHAQPQ